MSNTHLSERGKVRERELHQGPSQLPKGKARLQTSEELRRDWELLWAGTICPSLQVPEIFLMFRKILLNLLVAWKGSELVILKMKAPLVSDYLGVSIPHKYLKFLKISLTLSQFIHSWLILNSLLRLDLGQILPGLTIISCQLLLSDTHYVPSI